MPPAPGQRVYPFEPLDHLAGLSGRQWAEKLNITRRTVCRLRALGLTVDQADRLAMVAGLHPAEVWPTWTDDGLTVLDRMFVFEGGWRDDWEWKELSA